MKTYGLGKRLMALLLALTLVLSVVPFMALRASAARGDITGGDTGLVGDLKTNDTISWPIKIYDFMNDGMLFEYSAAQDANAGKSNPYGGFAYGGGEKMPMYGDYVIGEDYTSMAGYYKPIYGTYGTYTGHQRKHSMVYFGNLNYFANDNDPYTIDTTRSVVQPVKDVSPMYMRWTYANAASNSHYGEKTYGWVSNFAKDHSQYYSKDDLRYSVIVYKTNGNFSRYTRMYWAVAKTGSVHNSATDISDLNSGYGKNNDGLLAAKDVKIPASVGEWSYLVIDMKTDYTGTDSNGNTYGIASNWDKISGDVIAGVGMSIPLAASGEVIDISHIAYFGTREAAEYFGESAVAFDNDPGEYMGYDILNFKQTNSGNAITTSYGVSDYPTDPSRNNSSTEMWNMGCNQSYTMLWASTGGGWVEDDSIAGGTNEYSNGYYAYMIGKYMGSVTENNDNRANVPSGKGYVVSNTIFTMNQYGEPDPYDMSQLDLGYTLHNTLSDGVMTAGLLQSGMMTHTGVDGQTYRLMNYKSDTVAYIATLLRDTLIIPERDYWGYNYNFVKGSPSVEYYEDIDGDGHLDVAEDIDGDSRLDVNEDKNGNGVLDKSEDIDGDGNLDIFEDLDYDGVIDPAEDIDGDGHVDVFEDIDNDGKLDPGEDLDGDGKLDTIEYIWNSATNAYEWKDLNGNGKLDLTEDVNGDGKLSPSEDLDKDGKLDTIEYVWNETTKSYNWVDLNGNGKLDLTEDADGNGALDFGEDLDGDGRLDVNEDKDGDGHLDVNEDLNGNGKLDSRDLASALREDLQITFNMTSMLANYTNSQQGTYKAKLGSYSETITNMMKTDADGKTYNGLIGPYLQCKENINTFYDAAYYLLHNIFVANSYNQLETDYQYLVMAKATVKGGASDGSDKEAYVFDAGFTYSNQTSGIVYDKTAGTITAVSAENKHQIYYGESTLTTLNPFLPIDDSGEEWGGEFGVDGTPYFREDGGASYTAGGATYMNRNYNYVMAANGEMIYHYNDDLFFRFQGDDDVYMFINGELVLDIGAAHSITDVGFQMNDYVDEARKVLTTANFPGYEPGMTDEDFAKVLQNKGFTTTSTITVDGVKYDYNDIQRLHKLNLVDGRFYSVDFYYMERHGWGANMSIATNIDMTDPQMETDKNAYQGTNDLGTPDEIEYGGLIDDAQPVNYEFQLTNEGDTKLYKLSFEDDRIGVNMTYDSGLLTYGKPTVAHFTVGADTTISITGLTGAINLDGVDYHVDSSGNISNTNGGSVGTALPVEAGSMHVLRLYQYNNPTLYQDQEVWVKINGDQEYVPEPNGNTGIYTLLYGRNNKIPVAGIRVTDAKGGALDPSDLIITVDGYKSLDDYNNNKPIDTITIKVDSNEELMAFLSNLKDPKGQTESGEGVPTGENALYWGSGLWQHATVSISGMWYTLSDAEQEAKVFQNTVYTSAYKSMDDEVPIRGQAKHKVYAPGEPMYYQWANHSLLVEKEDLWNDVLIDSTDPSNPLYDQKEGIQILNNAGLDTLKMEIVDAKGAPATVRENMYSNGIWSIYSSDQTAKEGYRYIYFKNNSYWSQVSAYFWSTYNTSLTTWPGEAMTQITGSIYAVQVPEDAEYIIFNNGGNGTQTADLPLPDDVECVTVDTQNEVVDMKFTTSGMHMFYVKITSTVEGVDEKAMVPVVVHVADVKDSTYVLDYGLTTEDLNTNSKMFSKDDLLGNMGYADAMIMGATTTMPTYLGTYDAAQADLGNINRINFVKEKAENGKDGSVYLNVTDGRFYLGGAIGTDGAPIRYVGTRYTLDRQIWFEPTNFMDQEYDLWLAISVFTKGSAAPSDTNATGAQYHVPGPLNTTTIENVIDIGTEVQMFKKVTVLPATVVYYEDDFQGVIYNKDDSGSFVHHGEGSGSLTQGVANEGYGQDAAYQGSANAQYSGNSMTTINISDTSNVTSFSFTGTGFEIVSRTNSFDSASFVVDVYDSNNTLVNKIPVITEYTSVASKCEHKYHNTNGYCTYCGKSVSHTYPAGAAADNTAKCTVCGADRVKYYLQGYINREEVNTSEELTNSTLLFEDGKLTATFEYESWVGIVDENGKQYWTNGYAGDHATSVMLFAKDEISEPNRMHVPGGVKLEFNLVDNGEGGMILSYVTTDHAVEGDKTLYYDNSTTQWENVFIYYWSDEAQNMLVWPGIEMEKVEGTEDIYYYVVPRDAEYVIFNKGTGGTGNQTADMLIPGDGVIYNPAGDSWTTYDAGEEAPEAETYTITYKNVDGWEKVYAYYWSNTLNSGWPGVEMTPVEGETDLYTVTIPAGASNIIFNNNSGSQTSDLCVYGDGYKYDSGAWYDPDGDKVEKKTVHYVNAGGLWDEVYIYTWTPVSGGSVEHTGSWPGTLMSKRNGTDDWYFDVPEAATKVIFTNNKGSQTTDLTLVGITPSFTDAAPLYQTVYFENTNNWDNVYVHYWNASGISSAWPGVQMTYIGNNIYSANVHASAHNVIFHDGTDQTYTEDYVLPNKIVAFKNTDNWSSVTATLWSGEDKTTATVKKMNRLPGDDTYWYILAPVDTEMISFSNGLAADDAAYVTTGDLVLDRANPVYDYGVGSWTTEGPANLTMTMEYTNTDGWYDVRVHYLCADGTSTEWPGVPMDLVDGTTDEYVSEIPLNATDIMFTGVKKTPDLTMPDDDRQVYSNGTWYEFTDGTDREIYQVPVIRVTDLPLGTYTVKISGMPTYRDDTPWDQVANAKDQAERNEILKEYLKTTYLYIDGIRIFQPMGSTNMHYAATENGATFTELRNLLLDGSAALATRDNSTSYYTGNGYTWTENRNGKYLIDVASDWENSIKGLVYFKNTAKWSTVNALFHNASDSIPMAQIPGTDYWCCVVPNGDNVCFTNGTEKTEVVEQNASKCVFDYASGKWVDMTDASELTKLVFFADRTGWNQVKVYWTGGSNAVSADNAKSMIKVPNSIYYFISVPSDAETISFNNGLAETDVNYAERVNIELDAQDRVLDIYSWLGQTVYEGNKLDSIDNYMLVGPNNEVYMNGNLKNEAIVFYVTEQPGAANRTVQIAARALDAGLITSSSATGVEATLYQGVLINKPNGTKAYGWSAVDTIVSGTEQYYTLDYSNCPYTTDSNGNKTYQIALYVRTGMVSFTSVKTLGFDIPKSKLEGVEGTDLYYDGNQMLVAGSTEAKVSMTLNLSSISEQMDALSQINSAITTPVNPGASTETAVVTPTLTPAFPTVALEEEIRYNIYFTATDVGSVVEMGLIAFDEELTHGSIYNSTQNFSGYTYDGTYYIVSTEGIAAKNMGDTTYYKVYAKLTDGSYVYSSLFHFNAVEYVKSVLSADAYSTGLKQTCVALMNYGAAAQMQFGYKTDALMNSFLTDDQQAMVSAYNSSMVSAIVKADASKVGEFAAVSGGFSDILPSVSLEGAFAVNYYFTPARAVDGDMTLYCWDAETYNSADVLTKDNAISTNVMGINDAGQYWGSFEGIAAKELDSTVYVAAVYESDGVTYCTGVLAVSVSVLSAMQMGSDADLTALAESIIVYGNYAKSYFGK